MLMGNKLIHYIINRSMYYTYVYCTDNKYVFSAMLVATYHKFKLDFGIIYIFYELKYF